MKKFLTLISSICFSITPATAIISCSSSDSSALEPSHGWPPVDPTFIPVWTRFQRETQEKATACMGKMLDSYSKQYMQLYSARDLSNIGKDGFDTWGVKNSDLEKIKQGIAVSKDMYDYQMYSLRLYYIESNLSYLESDPQKRQLFDDEENEKLWAMVYFKGMPFYTKGDILYDFTKPDGQGGMQHADHYTVNIGFDKDETGVDAYDYYKVTDSHKNVEWNKGPTDYKVKIDDKEVVKKAWRDFKPAVKLKEEYYSFACEVYKLLFGKDAQHD